jgi:hypothetical protein
MQRLAALALLAVALPATAQTAPPPTPHQLSQTESARADARLTGAIAHLLAGRKAEAAPLLHDAIAAAASPADVAALQRDGRYDVFKRWVDARSAAMQARDYAAFSAWAWLIAADRLASAARSADPVAPDSVDDVFYLAYGFALSGDSARVRAFAAPFLAAPDPQFEAAFAADLTQRAQSMRSWGGERKPMAEALANLALSIFDRPGGRAVQPVRNLWSLVGLIRRTAGDVPGARAAYAKARAPDAPPGDAEIAMMFEAGESEAGIRAIQAALKLPPAPTLTLAATDRLIAVSGQSASGNRGSIAMYRIALDNYRRLLRPDHEKVEDTARTLAHLYLDTGDPALAETLLAPLMVAAERRWGPESNGAIDRAISLARAIAAQNRFEEAELIYRRVWSLAVKYDSYDDNDSLDAYRGIAGALVARGMTPAALAFTADGLARVRAAKDVNAWRRMFYLLGRAAILDGAGNAGDAEALVREAVALGDPDDKLAFSAGFHDPNHHARRDLATLLEKRGKAAEAEPIRRLILLTIEKSDMIPWEGVERNEAILALATNLTLQGKAEGAALFTRRVDASRQIFGADSPQLLAVAEPFAHALLRAGRPADALRPARLALAARTSDRFIGAPGGAGGGGGQRDAALARQRASAARLVIEAAWRTTPDPAQQSRKSPRDLPKS